MIVKKEAPALSGQTVQRFFPKPVRLTLQDHTVREFPAGLQNIPEEYAEHEWLKRNGVVEYKAGDPLPPLGLKAVPGTQAYAASVGASGIYDATKAPSQVSTPDPVGVADQADAEVEAMEAQLKVKRDQAKALRSISDKYVEDRDAKLKSAEADVVKEGARPEQGDINPTTGKRYKPADLEAAQAAWDEANKKPVQE